MTGWIIPPPKKPVKGKDEFKTLSFSKKTTKALKKGYLPGSLRFFQRKIWCNGKDYDGK